ncbi:MAG: response regulator [Bdellovibrionota bacterium]
MLKKILIVEDDNFFRDALRDLLKKKFTVLEAPNGKSAKEILSMQTVDVVLTDIQMPGLTGLELLEWALQYKPEVPFIIMTGFSMVLETKTAFDLGAKGFIAKPFKNQELLILIDSILGTQEPKQFSVEEVAKEFCKVSIEEFVAKPKIDFDVYIKLSETKYIKIAHHGEELPKEKVSHYKEKGVKHLFIRKEDFSKLVQFNLGLANIIRNRSDISIQKKMNFLKYTGEILLEKTFVDGLDKSSLHEAKTFTEITLDAITESPESFDLLNLLNTHSDHVYAHSLGVAMYSVMIAKELGFESNSALAKITMAGLFHDIGKKEIDREILDKPRHLVSREERQMIESHALRGQEILNALPNISSDVVQIVSEHHEDLEGLGYPLRKEKAALHPMSKILQCANIFIENALAGSNGSGKPALLVIAHMEKIYGRRVDRHCLNALKVLFKDAKA